MVGQHRYERSKDAVPRGSSVVQRHYAMPEDINNAEGKGRLVGCIRSFECLTCRTSGTLPASYVTRDDAGCRGGRMPLVLQWLPVYTLPLLTAALAC